MLEPLAGGIVRQPELGICCYGFKGHCTPSKPVSRSLSCVPNGGTHLCMPLHLTCSVYARSQSSNLTTISAVPPKSRLLKWPDHQWASWEDDRTNTHVVHLFRHHKTPYCSRYSSGGVFVLPNPNHTVCIYLHVAVLFTAVLHPSLCTLSHSVFLL